MRFIVVVLMVCAAASTSVGCVLSAVFDEQAMATALATTSSRTLLWPSTAFFADHDEAMTVLARAARSTGANIYRTLVLTSPSGRSEFDYCVIFGRPSSALRTTFSLTSGRNLTVRESQRGGRVTVSNTAPHGVRVVGVPRVTANAFAVSITPMAACTMNVSLTGSFTIEAASPAAERKFIQHVRSAYVAIGVPREAVHQLLRNDGSRRASTQSGSPLAMTGKAVPRVSPVAEGAMAMLMTLVGTAAVLRQGRFVGVCRLNGFSLGQTWRRLFGVAPVIALAITGLWITALLLVHPGTAPDLARSIMARTISAPIGMPLAMFAITAVLIRRTSLTDLAKGKL